MHSWVTRKLPRGVQSWFAVAWASMPSEAERRRRRARDERGHVEDAGALEVERGGGGEDQQEGRREEGEAARGSKIPGSRRASGRTRSRAGAGCRARCLPVRQAHPREDVAGDGEREHRRPDVDVERVEQRRRGGEAAERADAQRVEGEDERHAGAGAEEPRPPAHRVGEDRAEADRQHVGAAARERRRDRAARACRRAPPPGVPETA